MRDDIGYILSPDRGTDIIQTAVFRPCCTGIMCLRQAVGIVHQFIVIDFTVFEHQQLDLVVIQTKEAIIHTRAWHRRGLSSKPIHSQMIAPRHSFRCATRERSRTGTRQWAPGNWWYRLWERDWWWIGAPAQQKFKTEDPRSKPYLSLCMKMFWKFRHW